MGVPPSSLTNPLTPLCASPMNWRSEARLSLQNCCSSDAGGYLQQLSSSVTSMQPCQM